MHIKLKLLSIGGLSHDQFEYHFHNTVDSFPDCEVDAPERIVPVSRVRVCGLVYWQAPYNVRLWDLYEQEFTPSTKHHYVAVKVECSVCGQSIVTEPQKTKGNIRGQYWPVFVSEVTGSVKGFAAQRKVGVSISGKPDTALFHHYTACKECIIHSWQPC
nr:MAG: putative movement protein P1 [Sobemovirus sp.]